MKMTKKRYKVTGTVDGYDVDASLEAYSKKQAKYLAGRQVAFELANQNGEPVGEQFGKLKGANLRAKKE